MDNIAISFSGTESIRLRFVLFAKKNIIITFPKGTFPKGDTFSTKYMSMIEIVETVASVISYHIVCSVVLDFDVYIYVDYYDVVDIALF